MDREIVGVLKKKKKNHRSLGLNVFQLETAQTLQGFQNCQEIVLSRSNLPGSSKPNVFREDLVTILAHSHLNSSQIQL